MMRLAMALVLVAAMASACAPAVWDVEGLAKFEG